MGKKVPTIIQYKLYGGILAFPDSLRTPPPTQNKLYGDFGFSLISSVPAPFWHPPRTEEFLISRFSPYSTTFSKQVVRRFWLFTHFLRTSTSLTPTTYGGISYFPVSLRTPLPIPNMLYGDFGFSLISSVPAPSWLPPRTEILAFHQFPPYEHLPDPHHVRRNI